MSSAAVSSIGGQALRQVQHGEHTMEKLVLVHPSGKASCEVYLHGATVTSWKVLGSELLYLSPKAIFAPGKAIRGGIPVVFPQFGPGQLPQHGFARNQVWKHDGEAKVVKASGDISTELYLEDNEATRAIYPHHFKLVLTILLKPTALSMQLKVHNLNNDKRTMPFTTLLHTYLNVDDILKTSVRGLQGRDYADKPDGNKMKTETVEAVIFRGEVDRIYVDGGKSPVRIQDGGNCELLIKTTGFSDFVVWNPAAEKVPGDMPADDWKKFVCVEAGSVAEPIVLEAGKVWEGAQGISIGIIQDSDVARAVAEKTLAATGKL